MHIRPLLITAAVAIVLAACSPETQSAVADPPPAVDETDEEVHLADTGPLEEALARVNAAQQAADEQLAGLVAAAHQLDRTVAAFRDPASVGTAREAWSEADAAFGRAQPDGLRERYVELARAVDEARNTLREIAVDVPGGSAQAAYLEAEDASLVAVRNYAERTDALVRSLVTHWETYVQVHRATGGFVGERWVHRDGDEAADAYEVAVGRHVRALVVAQEEIDAALDVREEAAVAVNDAADRAAERWTTLDGDSSG